MNELHPLLSHCNEGKEKEREKKRVRKEREGKRVGEGERKRTGMV